MGWHTIITVEIFIYLSVVSIGESRLTIANRTSWISPEFLSRTVELSLNRSKCANVHMSGDSVAIKTIFEDFTRVYRGEYVLVDTTHHCYGHFMISSSANRVASIMETVPGKTSTEILIVIDDEVDESSMLFNVSLYGYANVVVVSRDGLRTLSENYLEPRVFNQISSYHEIVRKRGLVDFRGRELQAVSFYNPPFSYLETSVNQTIKGIEAEVFVPKNGESKWKFNIIFTDFVKNFVSCHLFNVHGNADASSKAESELDGVEIQLFLLMARRLNFTWTIRKPNNEAGKHIFGSRNGTEWTKGIIGQVHYKEVDIAPATCWLTLDNYEFTNMTHPWTEDPLHFLVPRPKSHRTPWALTTPFSRRVWIATFVMLIMQTVCVCAKAWINPKIPRRFRNFIVTLTELMGRLVGDSVTDNIRGLWAHFQLWHWIGIVLVTAYTSDLAARLASYGYEARIDTIEDFVAANLTWGSRSVPKFSLLLDASDPYARQLVGRFEVENTEAERHEKIVRGNYAISGRIVGDAFFPWDPIRESDFMNYRIMNDATTKHFAVFAVQPWLLEPVNEMILRLQEAGIIDYHLRDVTRRRETPERREVFVEYDVNTGEHRVLSLTPLAVAFAVLIVGHTISSVVFYLELRRASGKTSIRQLLRRIKKKRDMRGSGKNTGRYEIVVLTSLQGKKYGFPQSG